MLFFEARYQILDNLFRTRKVFGECGIFGRTYSLRQVVKNLIRL